MHVTNNYPNPPMDRIPLPHPGKVPKNAYARIELGRHLEGNLLFLQNLPFSLTVIF